MNCKKHPCSDCDHALQDIRTVEAAIPHTMRRKYKQLEDKMRCLLRCPRGWFCSRDKGHAGKHETVLYFGHKIHAVARWPS